MKRNLTQRLMHFIVTGLILISGTWNYLLAQDVKLTKEIKIALSSPYPVIDGNAKYYFSEDGTLITMKFAKKKLFIQKIDLKTMKQVSVREVTDLPADYVAEGFMPVPGKVLFFYSHWDKNNKTEQLFVRPVDFDKGNFDAKGELVLSIKGKITGTMVKTSRMGFGLSVTDKFDFDNSFDSTKVVIRYRKKPEHKDDSKNFDVIGMSVYSYDNGLNEDWSKEITMPYTEFKMDEMNFTVDSEGNAYILAKVYEGDKKRVKDDDGFILYNVELFKIDATTQSLTKIPVSLPQKYIQDITLFESTDKSLTLTGYYSNGNKRESGVDGAFFSTLTSTGEIKGIKSFEIPIDIINQNISKREKAKNLKKEEAGKGAQLRNLTFRSATAKVDGSILLVGEQYELIVTRSVDSRGQVRTTYRYHYDDIVVMKINSAGQMAWIKRLPKSQVGSAGRGGMSFKHLETLNSHYFLFLDNIKNHNLPEDQDPAKHSDGAGGFLTAYKLDDNTGDVSKLYIFDTRKVNGTTEVYQFAPSRIFQGSEHDFYTEVYKKNKEDILIRFSTVEDSK